MSALQALYTALYPYLRDYAGAEWSGRVQPRAIATASLDKPHLLFFWAGGGTVASAPVRDRENVVLTVKIVALSMATATAGMATISEALKNSGTQDVDPRLPAVAGWNITTVTQLRHVWVEESFETQSIYHAGYQFEFNLEAI